MGYFLQKSLLHKPSVFSSSILTKEVPIIVGILFLSRSNVKSFFISLMKQLQISQVKDKLLNF